MNNQGHKYLAVIFTSIKKENLEGYEEMGAAIEEEIKGQPGFLGVDHYSNEKEDVTISYWKDEEAILNWKNNAFHQKAQKEGKLKWYKSFRTRVAQVYRDYEFTSS